MGLVRIILYKLMVVMVNVFLEDWLGKLILKIGE